MNHFKRAIFRTSLVVLEKCHDRCRNVAGRYSVPQALEDLEVDEKAARRDRAFCGAMGQEELSGCGRVDLVEFGWRVKVRFNRG
jgi:hypothetical protein